MSKIWFITGAARGIGAEIARAALAAGDKVVATGRDRAKVAEAFAPYGERVLALALDVSSAPQALDAVAQAVAHFGRIDVLVNNAGYGQLGMFEQNTPQDITGQFDTNVHGTFHVTRAVLPVMRRQRSGRILNLSSIGGMIGFEGASVYCAAKFAVEGFSESLALEVARFGIHVTIVEPGFFRTDFLDGSSVRYGALEIDDYAQASASMRGGYDNYSHQQPGDPVKLGRALVQLAGAPKPPLRYAAGSDAQQYLNGKLDTVRAELAEWRVLSLSTDHDDVAAA
ncbi:oxidoreductase [Cupriavidus sp. BIC8F]|uniref:oxidoreductase n=1 Tax=Cupriavidus sp. BIC8F TaxID=3079014 RepID=UPI0029163216|nr:oxidoreductase [Cupriavidus sp. BIC8F]